MTPEDARDIVQLRLLVARAANNDSLAWWDDQSFTTPAGFILERTFPVAPLMAARSLALAAAFARHEAVCPTDRLTMHLFRLDPDNQDRLVLRFAPLDDIPVPDQPITFVEQLRQLLLQLLDEPAPCKVVRQDPMGAVQIAISPGPAGLDPLVHRARALAWAYLAGSPGRPVFPYCLEHAT